MTTLTKTTMLFALAFVPAAYSQSAPVLRANVPFEFRVGDTRFDAGAYLLNKVQTGFLTLIRSEDGHTSAFAVTIPLDAGLQSVSPRLIFRRYGDTYFLAEIWTGSSGSELLPAAMERELIAENAAPVKVLLALAR